MTDIPDKLRDLLDLFATMEDRQDRIMALIDIADKFEQPPPEIATAPYPESARVPNCESEAFAFAQTLDDGSLRYHFAVENPQGVSAMAMAAILDQTVSGAPPEQALAVGPDIIYTLFGRELSMGKSAGLMGMIQMMHLLTKRHAQTGAASSTPSERAS